MALNNNSSQDQQNLLTFISNPPLIVARNHGKKHESDNTKRSRSNLPNMIEAQFTNPTSI